MRTDLSRIYRGYIACLNQRDWARLGDFVGDNARHNGQDLGLAGYRAMLEEDVRTIPDLQFNVGLLLEDPPHIAARLDFVCAPTGDFLGLPINGRTISFAENVFYRFDGGKITEVWSVIDKVGIEAQL